MKYDLLEIIVKPRDAKLIVDFNENNFENKQLNKILLARLITMEVYFGDIQLLIISWPLSKIFLKLQKI